MMPVSGSTSVHTEPRVQPKPNPPHNPLISGMLADRLFGWLARGAAILTLLLLLGIMASLVAGAWPSISKYGLGFLTSTVWDPVQDEYGGLVMIYGTLATSIIA